MPTVWHEEKKIGCRTFDIFGPELFFEKGWTKVGILSLSFSQKAERWQP